MRRLPWPALLVGLVLVGGVSVGLWKAASPTHADGEGDLALAGSPDAWSADVVDPQGRTDFTFGLEVCNQTGVRAIVLTSVAATAYVGSGATLIGARTFERALNEDGILETDGYPPTQVAADRLRDLAGSEVRILCNGYGSTEILIGLRINGPTGGGWRGVSIAYTVGSRARVLLANEYLVICGTVLRCHADMVTRDMPASSP